MNSQNAISFFALEKEFSLSSTTLKKYLDELNLELPHNYLTLYNKEVFCEKNPVLFRKISDIYRSKGIYFKIITLINNNTSMTMEKLSQTLFISTSYLYRVIKQLCNDLNKIDLQLTRTPYLSFTGNQFSYLYLKWIVQITNLRNGTTWENDMIFLSFKKEFSEAFFYSLPSSPDTNIDVSFFNLYTWLKLVNSTTLTKDFSNHQMNILTANILLKHTKDRLLNVFSKYGFNFDHIKLNLSIIGMLSSLFFSGNYWDRTSLFNLENMYFLYPQYSPIVEKIITHFYDYEFNLISKKAIWISILFNPFFVYEFQLSVNFNYTLIKSKKEYLDIETDIKQKILPDLPYIIQKQFNMKELVISLSTIIYSLSPTKKTKKISVYIESSLGKQELLKENIMKMLSLHTNQDSHDNDYYDIIVRDDYRFSNLSAKKFYHIDDLQKLVYSLIE
ncbi:helix-turn-helix domain-containing protein [Enterococcus faecalis]|uniref:helix-turn-helix domain-containing protein n=1 Tax=Enterococcus faecalis TaxID=1351 RepID=UPI00138766D4|nr:helix-turn-helix domain-containing protein [Enterococcus faecalis]MEB7428023.1 helix-turn-helix domain-containing protein [Enterococcus faecalis]